jgi:putative NIF3 family GTP cyclohydrolase 1 type 2
MLINRRSFVLTGAALAATPLATLATPQAAAAPVEAVPLTAAEVVRRIQAHVGIPWMTTTVDRIVAGSPDTPVKAIATTMMATLDVLERAAADGRNMIITHEPTFYSHQDTTQDLLTDPTYRYKTDFIVDHNLVVFRFHDHWHRMAPDGINVGMIRELGWEKNVIPGQPRGFIFPPTPLADFVNRMAAKLNAHSMRIVGDPTLPIQRVSASWGYASLMPDMIKILARPDIDLLIVGETREWEMVEYVADQVTSGLGKALILLNHVVSEQAGMKYCVEWLKPFLPEVSIAFVPTKEPFWSIPQLR